LTPVIAKTSGLAGVVPDGPPDCALGSAVWLVVNPERMLGRSSPINMGKSQQ